jgi:hypothetical protein
VQIKLSGTGRRQITAGQPNVLTYQLFGLITVRAFVQSENNCIAIDPRLHIRVFNLGLPVLGRKIHSPIPAKILWRLRARANL